MKMTPIRSFVAVALPALAIAMTPVAGAQSTVYLDSLFTNNSQNLPNNSTWYGSGGSTQKISNGALTFTPTDNSREALTYFTAPGAAVNIAEGMELKLSFTFHVAGLKSNGSGFRIGLFDSKGSRVSTNNYGTRSELEPYTGYGLFTNLRSGSDGASSLYARNPSNTSDYKGQLIRNTAMFDALADSAEPGPDLPTTGASVNGYFSITNNGDAGVVIRYSIGDKLVASYTDTEFKYMSFDTIGFAFRNSQGSSITFTDMKVSLGPAIPEAGTTVLALSATGLLVVLLLRRRRG